MPTALNFGSWEVIISMHRGTYVLPVEISSGDAARAISQAAPARR